MITIYHTERTHAYACAYYAVFYEPNICSLAPAKDRSTTTKNLISTSVCSRACVFECSYYVNMHVYGVGACAPRCTTHNGMAIGLTHARAHIQDMCYACATVHLTTAARAHACMRVYDSRERRKKPVHPSACVRACVCPRAPHTT